MPICFGRQLLQWYSFFFRNPSLYTSILGIVAVRCSSSTYWFLAIVFFNIPIFGTNFIPVVKCNIFQFFFLTHLWTLPAPFSYVFCLPFLQFHPFAVEPWSLFQAHWCPHLLFLHLLSVSINCQIIPLLPWQLQMLQLLFSCLGVFISLITYRQVTASFSCPYDSVYVYVYVSVISSMLPSYPSALGSPHHNYPVNQNQPY